MLQSRLNDKLIKSLPFTQGNHAFITDTINKNLKLVVSSSQKVFFFAHPGAVVWRIGVFPAVTTDKARATAARLAREAASMHAPDRSGAGTAPTPGAIWTFAAVVQVYIEQLPFRLHNKSAENDQKFLRRYVLDPTFEHVLNKHVSDVTDIDIAMIIYKILDRPAPAVARNCLMKIRHLFRWAMSPERRRRFELEENPTQHLLPRNFGLRPRYQVTYLSDSDMGRLLVAVHRMPRACDRAKLLCVLLTGTSLASLSGMRWSELDLAKQIWMRPAQDGTVVQLPLSDAVTTLLNQLRIDAMPADDSFVFCTASSRTRNLPKQRSELLSSIEVGKHRPAIRWMDVRRTVRASLYNCGLRNPWTHLVRPSPMEAARKALNEHARRLDALRAGRPSSYKV